MTTLIEIGKNDTVISQYGTITGEEWVRKEKARIERGPYPEEEDYKKRKAEIKRVRGKVFLLIDKVC